MSPKLPIKTAVIGKVFSSFYMKSIDRSYSRYVALIREVEKIIALISHFTAQADGAINLRILDLEDRENSKEYEGDLSKTQFQSAFLQFQSVFLHDGFHVLMILIPELDDFLVFDEHGLIYIYSVNDYSEYFKKLGIPLKIDEPLIEEFDHYHFRSASGMIELQQAIQLMKLELQT